MNIRLIIHYHHLYSNMSENSENETVSFGDNNSEHLYDTFSEWASEEENQEDNEDDNEEESIYIEQIDEDYSFQEIIHESSTDESSSDESGNESQDNESGDDENQAERNQAEENQNTQELDTNESETQDNKCVNHILCKNKIYQSNSIYCKPCYLFLHKKINYEINNVNNNVCPLCLSDNSDDIILKLFTCDHTLCYKCIHNIYWYDNNINNIIKNPYPQIHKKWVAYITSVKSRKLKCFVIYKLVNNIYTDFNEIYNELIKKINLKLIPSIFRRKLKELVFYQSQYEIFKTNNSYNKYIMRESIRICPYCKAYKN